MMGVITKEYKFAIITEWKIVILTCLKGWQQPKARYGFY